MSTPAPSAVSDVLTAVSSPTALDLFGQPIMDTPAQQRRGRPRKTTPAAPSSGDAPDTDHHACASPSVEAMAHALEQHPDYRVLRRLKPILHFPQQPQGKTATVLIIDTETTGLDATRERIIELALLRVHVDVSSGLPVGDVQVYDGFEDPGRPIPPAITQLTGITDAQVRGETLNEPEITRLLTGVDVVIAHNAGFDRPFVEARLPMFAHVAWACSWADIDWKQLGYGSAKLEHLAASFGWFYDAHRAETDCHALLTVLTQARPAQEGTHLHTLLTAAQQMHHKLYATGAPFESKDLLKARGYRWDGTQKVWLQMLRSDAELTAELRWLTDTIYMGQPSRVRVETLDARHRHSIRPGVATMRLLGAGALI